MGWVFDVTFPPMVPGGLIVPPPAMLRARPKSIAFVSPYLTEPGTWAMARAFEADASERGWEFTVVEGADPRELVEGMQEALLRPLDAMVIQVDPKLVVEGLEAAADLGVPVAGMNADDHPLLIANVASDSAEMGAQTASYLVERLGEEGNIVLIGHDRFPAARERRLAAERVFAQSPGVRVIARLCADVTTGSLVDARRQIEHLLLQYPAPGTIDGIWAAWDQPALGALQAIEAAGRQEEGIVIVGIDGTAKARRAIDDGSCFEASVAQDFGEIARCTADVLARVFQGQPIEERTVRVGTELIATRRHRLSERPTNVVGWTAQELASPSLPPPGS